MWFLLMWLDLTAAVQPTLPSDLHIQAVVEGRRVAARLVNSGDKTVELVIGYTCGGPQPFSAVVDGVARSFQTSNVPCTGNAMLTAKLKRGDWRLVPSETVILDDKAHLLSVQYAFQSAPQNVLASANIWVPTSELVLGLVAIAKPNRAVDIELTHRWTGSTRMRFLARWTGVCASPVDELSVDGKPQSFIETVCDGPVAGATEELGPGEVFVNRATIHLSRGHHRLRARYHVTEDALRFAGKKGNIGDWLGDVRSAEFAVEVR